MRRQIGDCTLYLGNSETILWSLEDVGAIVTDPPYGINRHKSGHEVMKNFGPIVGDGRPFNPKDLFCFGETQIIWGANHFCQNLIAGGAWLMWLKHDPTMFGRKSMSPFELAWTNIPGADKAFKHIWDGSIKEGRSFGKKHVHPTEKPVELMMWCLEFVKPDSTVCDPYMGSGTTGVACAILGRKFIGVEIDEQHFETASARIEDAYRQGNLFAQKPETPATETGALDLDL